MPRRLPIGARVALRSGGPVMLVVDYERDLLICAWRGFAGAHETAFPPACLWQVSGT